MRTILIFLTVLGLIAAGCTYVSGYPRKIAPIPLDTSKATASLETTELASVLDKVSQVRGKVRTKELKEARTLLDQQLAKWAVTGPQASPELFSSPQDELAFWLNARTAWSLRIVLHHPDAKSISVYRYQNTPITLNGTTMTLDQIDEILTQQFGWMAVVVAPCVRTDRAVLPDSPFQAEKIDETVIERFNDLLDNETRTAIDVKNKSIEFPPTLWAARQEILQTHRQTYGAACPTLTSALLPLTKGSAHRRLQDAIGYRCVRKARGTIPTLTVLK